MLYLLILVFIAIGYHTFTYGIYVLKKEKNKLAAFGTFLIAIAGSITPIVLLIMKF